MSPSETPPKRMAKATLGRLVKWAERFRDVKILVVGDLIVDEFVWGKVERISPEAPVPVVHVSDRSLRLGGAANVVHNLRALGARVLVSGLVGDDAPGRWLVHEVKRKGVPTGGIVRATDRPSSLKTRVIAHSQQVVRIDQEASAALSESQMEEICAYVRRKTAEVDGVIVSDYGKGVVSECLMQTARAVARDLNRVVTVDPKTNHFSLYRDMTAVTPNHREAVQAAGMTISSEESLLLVGKKLLEELRCRVLLITRGEDGMSLFSQDGEHQHIPTLAREVFDVTGAGDTVISAFTLGLCVGASPWEAAFIANLAAGIVVGEVGTAAVRNQRLRRVLQEMERVPRRA